MLDPIKSLLALFLVTIPGSFEVSIIDDKDDVVVGGDGDDELSLIRTPFLFNRKLCNFSSECCFSANPTVHTEELSLAVIRETRWHWTRQICIYLLTP